MARTRLRPFWWTGIALPMLGLSAACVPSSRPATPVAARSASVAAPATKPVATAPVPPATTVPEKWRVAYERRCGGSITEPVISPSGKAVVFCESLYDASTGIFTKRIPIGARAFVSESDIVRDDYGGGAALYSTATSSERLNVRTGLEEAPVLSPDGTKLLGMATRAAPKGLLGEDTIVTLRKASTLDTLSSITFKGSGHATLGFAADGTPLVFTQEPCKTFRTGQWSTKTDCPDAALYTWNGRALVHGASIFDGAHAVAFVPGQDAAALIDAKGAAHVVALSDGHVLSDLPNHATPEEDIHIAISADTAHIALSSSEGLTIYTRHGDHAEVSYEASAWQRLSPESLRFAPDGRSLYAANNMFLQVLSLDATLRTDAPLELAVKAPKGFHKFEPTNDSISDRSPGGTIGFVSSWSSKKGVTFTLLQEDAREFDPNLAPEAWGNAVVARFVGNYMTEDDAPMNPAKDLHMRAWKTKAGRNVEFETHFSDGCDPSDNYYRFAERGGILYRGELTISMFRRPKRKTLNHWLEAFFDKPLGAAERDASALAAVLPKPPEGPC